MRPASCGITPEGWPTIGITALTALVFACLGWPVPAVLALALCWFAFHFFRDPERVVPTAPGLAVSPADGRVIRIERKPDPLLFGHSENEMSVNPFCLFVRQTGNRRMKLLHGH